MVTWHATTQKTNAEEGGGAGGNSGSWWDMRYIAPEEGQDISTKHLHGKMIVPFYAEVDLFLHTNKTKDPASDDGYNEAPLIHHFNLNLTDAEYEIHPVIGKNAFNVKCIDSSGVITSSFQAAESIPANAISVSSNCVVGTYAVTLTIYIARDQGGPDVKTMIFGVVSWVRIGDPTESGSTRFPETGNLELTNTFESKLNE
jgi:hypothetical protein